MAQGAAKEAGILRQWLLWPQTERLLPFALRLLYIFICMRKGPNPAPHSLTLRVGDLPLGACTL